LDKNKTQKTKTNPQKGKHQDKKRKKTERKKKQLYNFYPLLELRKFLFRKFQEKRRLFFRIMAHHDIL